MISSYDRNNTRNIVRCLGHSIYMALYGIPHTRVALRLATIATVAGFILTFLVSCLAVPYSVFASSGENKRILPLDVPIYHYPLLSISTGGEATGRISAAWETTAEPCS